jgi:hypothetical protein
MSLFKVLKCTIVWQLDVTTRGVRNELECITSLRAAVCLLLCLFLCLPCLAMCFLLGRHSILSLYMAMVQCSALFPFMVEFSSYCRYPADASHQFSSHSGTRPLFIWFQLSCCILANITVYNLLLGINTCPFDFSWILNGFSILHITTHHLYHYLAYYSAGPFSLFLACIVHCVHPVFLTFTLMSHPQWLLAHPWEQ